MTERMLDIEVKMHLQKIGMFAQVAMGIPCEDLLHEFSMHHTLTSLFDPTAYIAMRDNVGKNERVVRALAAFQKVVREEWPELDQVSE